MIDPSAPYIDDAPESYYDGEDEADEELEEEDGSSEDYESGSSV